MACGPRLDAGGWSRVLCLLTRLIGRKARRDESPDTPATAMGLSEVGYLLAQALSGISGRPREGNGLEEAKMAWYNCDKCALGKENRGRRRVRALCCACLGECGRMRVYMMVAWNIQSAKEADLHEPTPQPVTPEAHRASQPTQPSFTLLVPIRTMQQYTFKFVI